MANIIPSDKRSVTTSVTQPFSLALLNFFATMPSSQSKIKMIIKIIKAVILLTGQNKIKARLAGRAR